MYFRLLNNSDYQEYVSLLNQFRETNISLKEFKIIYKNILRTSEIWLAIDESTKNIIGTGTIIYEYKFIHNGGIVAHIEDLIIHEKYKGNGYGKAIMEYLKEKARTKNCYKIILNCSKNTQKFYEKNGFSNQNLEMEFRF